MPKKQANHARHPQKEERAARMKKLEQQEPVDLISSDSFCEEINFTNHEPSRQAPPASSPQIDTCLMCLDQNFQSGRYILDCAHCLCSDCVRYWQAVSDLCPVCHTQSKSILSTYCGQSRVKKVGYVPVIPSCSRCGSDRHYHLMYFCDECNINCVHTYCDPTLRQEQRGERWVCEDCIYKDYYQNRYNEESVSEDVQEIDPNQQDDSFVVDDDVLEYVSQSEPIEIESESPQIKRQKKKVGGKSRGRKY